MPSYDLFSLLNPLKQKVYLRLLDMYLDPQNGKEPMFKAAVRLLHNHGETLDPLQVLEVRNHSSPYVKKKLILLLILQLFQLLVV